MIGTSEALLLLLLIFFLLLLFVYYYYYYHLFVFFFVFLIIQSQAAFVYCLYVARFTIVHSNSIIIIYLFIYLFLKGCDLYVLSAFISLSHFIKCHTNVKAIFL